MRSTRADVRQAEVHPLDIFIRGHAGFVLGNARKVEQPLLAELILRIQQALFTFRMRRLIAQSNAGKKTTPRVRLLMGNSFVR